MFFFGKNGNIEDDGRAHVKLMWDKDMMMLEAFNGTSDYNNNPLPCCWAHLMNSWVFLGT
jgi:hypothetical protein